MTIRIESIQVRRLALRLDLARYVPSAVLAGYGIFILSLFARHALTMYINPNYVWPTTIAGALLVVLAGVNVRRKTAASCAMDACCEGDSCGCGTAAKTRMWPYLVLSIPLLFAVLFPPRSLAAFSARQRGIQIAGTGLVHGIATIKRVSLSVDTRTFGMQDWVGALSADPNPNDYKGKPIAVTGVLIHDSASVPPGYVMVIRYQVTCCIADARPVGVVVKDTSHGALQDNQWVKVVGVMGAASYQGQQMAVVEPKQLVATKSSDPYMY